MENMRNWLAGIAIMPKMLRGSGFRNFPDYPRIAIPVTKITMAANSRWMDTPIVRAVIRPTVGRIPNLITTHHVSNWKAHMWE
jgi:hypothetical protein